MPLISVGAFAKGFIAIGWMGRGVILIAQFGYGVIAVTQFGFGLISISQFGLGLVTVGQFAFAVFLGIGQFALGFIANGISAAGYYRMTGPGVWKRVPEMYHLVEANPFPLLVWGALWTVIFVFLYSQRDKFSRKMSPGDIFRSRKKNRDDAIRARAAARSSNQAELLDIVLNDPSDMVKKAAIKNIFDPDKLITIAKLSTLPGVPSEIIGKIEDPAILGKIAAGAASEEARISAIRILAKKDPSRLVVLACEIEKEKILDTIIDAITDQSALRHIIKNAASPRARLIALHNLADPGTEEMYDIIKEEKDIAVSESAVHRITDTRVLADIIRGDYHEAVRKSAIEQMEDKKLLAVLESENLPGSVKTAIRLRLNNLRPVYYSIKAEFACPFCSQPVFINTPARNIACRSCLRDSAIPGNVWKNIRDAGLGVGRFMGPINLLIEKGRKPPVCSKCQEPLPTDDVATGSTAPVTCASCGTVHSTFPLPKWLTWSKNAEQVFASEDVGKTAGPDGFKPVAISCIKCGAPLEVTPTTPRNAACGYCNTVQYLPDQLWRSIHPVTIKQPWYIRCGYRERK